MHLRDPFDELADLRQRMHRLVEETVGRLGPAAEAGPSPWAPRVDIAETPEALIFEMDLPGLSAADVEIQIAGDRLTVKGERKATPGREFVRVERPRGPFERSFAIGVPVERAAAQARFRDGVLEVILPKAQQEGPQSVSVAIE